MSVYGRAIGRDIYGDVRPSYPHRADRVRGDGPAHPMRVESDAWSRSPEAEVTDLSGVTVLLVEDDEISREALEMIFAYHGAQVVAVASAEEALASYEQSLPTVVVSDIGLPDEDGCALIRHIRVREFGRGRHTPAVAISAFPGRETSERARGAGFDIFLPKPIEVATLLRTVSRFSATDA